MFDSEAEPDVPLPDRVPDELVKRYGASARRAVRHSRTWRYPVARRMRTARSTVRDGDLWMLTLMVFAWSIIAAGAVGALVYASVLFPWAVLYIVVPVLALFGVSFVVALVTTRRRTAQAPGEPDPDQLEQY